MHECDISTYAFSGRHAMSMKKNEGVRSPRQMLEWLFRDTDFFKRGRLNTRRLSLDMVQQLGTGAPSQSTLHRMWTNVTRQADDATLDALSRFTDVPTALIRGEVYSSAAQEWGMEITVGEVRILRALHELTYDQRKAIYEQVRSMLPSDKSHLVPRLPERNVVDLRPKNATRP